MRLRALPLGPLRCRNLQLMFTKQSLSQIVGPATVTAASGSTALVINGSANQQSLTLNSVNGTAVIVDMSVVRGTSTINGVFQGPNINLYDNGNGTQTVLQNSGGQTEIWQYNSGYTQILKCTVNHDLIARGIAVCLRATAIEQRTSTTTLTNSTQLQPMRSQERAPMRSRRWCSPTSLLR